MNPRRMFAIGLVLLAVGVAWAGVRYSRSVAATSPAAAADEAGPQVTLRFFKYPAAVQSFTLRDLDGRPITADAFKGKVTLINFWATWCGPCRAEIPQLVALQNKYRDTLQIIGISEDEAPPEAVRKFAVEHQINYPVAMVTPDVEKVFPGIVALPTTYVLDRDSRVVQKHVGMLSGDTTEAETRALAGLPINATIEHVDQAQGLKLENGAQATNIPGVDLAKLPADRRTEALEKLNSQPCTCGCDLTVARCRVDDPTCGVSLPIARQIVQQVAERKN
jgi:thiol-disulfide isomerase/thioredoxin